MTALDRFERLESGGIWRDSQNAQRRDVTVSFGKATLVLSDGAGRPLAHWSLPAIQRRNLGTRPAIFAPDDDASETLEIADDLMVDAIEEVRKALIAAQPHPGRLRGGLTAAILLVIGAAAVIWGPAAFTQKTLSVVPQAQRAQIGATVLGHYQRLTGPTCRRPQGTTALAKLHSRLIGPGSAGQLVVVQDLQQGAAALPGGVIMIDRRLVEQHDDPAIVSGYILAAVAGRQGHDPLALLLDQAGLQTTMALFTTGEVDDTVLQDYAGSIHQTTTTTPSPGALRAAFDAAQIAPAPYLDDSAAPDDTRAAFAGISGDDTAPILNDSDWVRLQGICDG